MIRFWRSARLRTVAGTVAAIGAGVMMAPLAGLGGFGNAVGSVATSPAVFEIAHHAAVKHVRPDVTELTDVKSARPAGMAVMIVTRASGGNQLG